MRLGLSSIANSFFTLICALGMSACGIGYYPGQPGMKTNDYVKLDQEDLDWDGLWVYEASYDNTEKGNGIDYVLTKLYPNAQTFTTNVRTNADGTLYRHKRQAKGALIQLISIPALNKYIVPEDSMVWFVIDYDSSMDEIDDTNLADRGLFVNTPPARLARNLVSKVSQASENLSQKFSIIKAGTFTGAGLSYRVSSLSLGEEEFTLPKKVQIETMGLNLSGIKTNFDQKTKQEFAQFINSKFPKGYSGEVAINVEGAAEPLRVKLRINTLETLKASGATIVRSMSSQEAEVELKKLRASRK